jgi:predicted anti-sigma-YlaC factor YlaD
MHLSQSALHTARAPRRLPSVRCVARCAARALATSVLAASVLTACSVERFAAGKLGDALAGSGSTYARDDDPELVRAAAPFSLKLIESLLEKDPEHEGLLLAATRGFTQYAYAFVEQDADRIEDADLARSRELQERARRLYHRAHVYGLRGLEVRHPGFRECFDDDPHTALADARAEDVPLLYWTAASWGLELALSKDDPEALLGLPQVEALIDRALALDESWNEGAIHTFLVTYESSRPSGRREWVDRARTHFERAVALSHGTIAAPYVAFAEAVPLKEQNQRAFEELLGRALAIDLAKNPEARLENEIARARARWLLSRESELFLEETDALESDVRHP